MNFRKQLSRLSWGGGLLALLFTLWGLRRTEDANADLVLGRFSQLAAVCLITLAGSGIYRAVVEVGDADNLFDTAYGATLLIKIALFLPLIALAAMSALIVRRRPQRTSQSARSPWHSRLRWTIAGEVVLVVAVLGLTGHLTGLPPAREAFGSGLVLRSDAGDISAVLVVSPGEVGTNSFDVYLRDSGGQPVADAEKVALIFAMVEHDMGQHEAVATNAGGGHYLARGSYLAMAGTWQTQLLVRRPGRDDVRISLVIRPRPPNDSVPLQWRF